MLADDCDFSISSGRSTLPPRMPRVAYSNLRPWCEGLEGAVNARLNAALNLFQMAGRLGGWGVVVGMWNG